MAMKCEGFTVASRRCVSWQPTFVAVTNSVEVDVIAVIVEEHQRQPRVKRVDWNHEEYTHDPALLTGACVITQMLINLSTANSQ